MENIIRKTIKLVTPQDVKDFCFASSELPRNVSAMASHGKAVVDAKSILGMFSLDLSETVTLTMTSENDFDIEKINSLFKKWEV